jgi:hypothetical protein
VKNSEGMSICDIDANFALCGHTRIAEVRNMLTTLVVSR